MRIVGYGNHENVEVEIAVKMATVIFKISDIFILKFMLREDIFNFRNI